MEERKNSTPRHVYRPTDVYARIRRPPMIYWIRCGGGGGTSYFADEYKKRGDVLSIEVWTRKMERRTQLHLWDYNTRAT